MAKFGGDGKQGRMYGIDHPENREGEMELLLDLETGEAEVKSCRAVSGADE